MGYVYCINIEGTDDRKIGITDNLVVERLKQLQVGNPYTLLTDFILECDNPNKIETILHNALKDRSLRGEWFKLSMDELITYIAATVLLFPDIKIIERQISEMPSKPIDKLRKARNEKDLINLIILSLKLGLGKEESLKIILGTYKSGKNIRWMTGIKVYDRIREQYNKK